MVSVTLLLLLSAASAAADADVTFNGMHDGVCDDTTERCTGRDEASDEEFLLMQTKTFLQKAALHENDAEIDGKCLAVNVALGIYRGSQFSDVLTGKGYTVTPYNYEAPGGDHDAAWLVEKGGECLLAFQGSNAGGDFMNNFNFGTTTKWGVDGLHSGVVTELEPLLNLVDFAKMKTCTKLTVAGHSMGGALAQLTSLLINNKNDPLKAGLTVAELYTFGAMSAVEIRMGNDKNTETGCFPGGQYWYAETGSKPGAFAVDVANQAISGGQLHDPVKSDKYYIGDGTTVKSFPCGTPLPADEMLIVKDCPEGGACGKWMMHHMSYVKWTGCPAMANFGPPPKGH